MDNETRLTRDYELMAILIPDMADEDTQAAIDRVSGYITDAQGEITETLTDSPWGRRRLAYAIRHEGVDYRDGFYVVVHFTALPSAIADIERELKLDTRVIRYLLVMDDPKAGERATGEPQDTAAVADTDADADSPQVETAPATADRNEDQAAPATDAAPVQDETAPTAADVAPVQDETAPTAADVAPVQDETAQSAAEETPVEAPARGTEATIIETADAIEGEEEPAPADGPEAESDSEEA